MTQKEIIEMAREAGIRFRINVFHSGYCDGVHGDELEAFAKLIAEKEREACASMLEDLNKHAWNPWDCAAAIRDRGNT